MAHLILSLDGQTLAEYNLNKARLTIGRYPDNDIRIDNLAVSGHHALIVNVLNDSFLEDLNSTNGTYVNGKLIKKHLLKAGDVITTGQHQLRYVEDDEVRASEFQKTTVLGQDLRQYDAPRPAAPIAPGATAVLQRPAAPAPVAEAPAVPARPLIKGRLQVLSGSMAGRELELVKTLTTIGRPGVQVAAVSRRADGFYLMTVETAHADDYPLVNGLPIGMTALQLEDHDVIQVAGVKLGFFTD